MITLAAGQTLGDARHWLTHEGAAFHHHGFPIVEGDELLGVLTQRELARGTHAEDVTLRALVSRPAVVIGPQASARQAADLMVRERVGRLPVVEAGRLVGIVTRSDLVEAHANRLASEQDARRVRKLGRMSAQA